MLLSCSFLCHYLQPLISCHPIFMDHTTETTTTINTLIIHHASHHIPQQPVKQHALYLTVTLQNEVACQPKRTLRTTHSGTCSSLEMTWKWKLIFICCSFIVLGDSSICCTSILESFITLHHTKYTHILHMLCNLLFQSHTKIYYI